MSYLSAAQGRFSSLAGKHVGIVGLGREGVDLVRFLSRWGARITVSDQADATALGPAMSLLDGIPATYRLGNQAESDLLDCEEVFVSPGVSQEIPVVAAARRAGIPISSGTRLFFELCPGRLAAITGSSGKTTTTSLVGAILRAAKLDVVVGGNIGQPLLSHLDNVRPETWVVLELSSFQLSDMTQSPHVGAILNITPNHLDRHPDMADYIRAKSNLVRYQGPDDTAVLNADDPTTAGLTPRSQVRWFSLEHPTNGAWFDGAALRFADDREAVLERSELKLRGLHNVANALAAAAVARAVGCPPDAIRSAMRSFEPVPHRLEEVARVDGVTYVNDSIATSPERSIAALRALESPIVLIAGGRDKHLPMEDWARVIGERARALVVVGEAAPLIRTALEEAQVRIPIVSAGAFSETVPLARDLAQAGDTVLLAPGCTSFDEFRDYEARGAAFRAAVHGLRAGES